MSLIGGPQVIFLDEPTTGLDPEARKSMWQTIKMLAQGGTTIFLTTQYLDEADELADIIALLHEGKIVAQGTATELKKLVPGGVIKFTFSTVAQLENAAIILRKDFVVTKADNTTLTVAADGNVKQITELFIRLRDSKLEPASFSQQVPTLDDVFFKLTGKKEEKK